MNGEIDGLLGLVLRVGFVSGGLLGFHFWFANANPRWRVWLWRTGSISLVAIALAAFCKPLIAFRLPTAIRVAALSSKLPQAVTNEASLPASEVTVETPTSVLPNGFDPEVSTEPRNTSWISSQERRSSPLSLAAIVWLSGVSLMIVKWILSQWRLAALLARTERVPDWVQQCTNEIALQLGIQTVDVVSTTEFRAPSVAGLFQPKILLPQRMLAGDNRDDLNAALTHELAHVRGSDLAWDAWIRAVSISLWPNPLCWKMPKAHRNACERLCDGISSQHVGGEAYQSSLARIALQLTEANHVAGMAMASTPDVIARLRFLQKSISTASLGRRGVVSALTFAITCGFIGISGIDTSPAVVLAETPDPSTQISPPAIKPEETPDEFESKAEPKKNTEPVVEKPLEIKSPKQQATQTKSKPQQKLEKQAVVTINGKTIYAMLPPQPDYEATRRIGKRRVWQLANGKQLRGQLRKVGHLYISIKVGEKEIDVKKSDLDDADLELVHAYERLRKEQAAFARLRQEKAREAVLVERLPEFRRQLMVA